MAISPGTAIGLANASPSVDRKLGSDYGFLLGRPFRSKNAERVPLATVQKLPFFRSMGGRRNRVCHCCRASENNIVARIRCFSCQELFCKTCIETWHSELSEFDVKNACPVCRGCCSCINCKSGRDTAGGFKVASSRDLSHSEWENASSNMQEYSHFNFTWTAKLFLKLWNSFPWEAGNHQYKFSTSYTLIWFVISSHWGSTLMANKLLNWK